jgi:hypothetical protein
VATRIRRQNHKLWSRALLLVGVLGTKACLLSFDRYPEADPCLAARDAGVDPKNAPDPVLRGCEAGPVTSEGNQDSQDSLAGASGMGGEK